MVGLVDIAPATEQVAIRGQSIAVCGVSAMGVAQLLARFPDLRRMFSGRETPLEDLLSMGGEIVNAVIAAGTGEPGNAEAEAAAGRLTVEEQVDLLDAILRVTLPRGIGPFVEKLLALGAVLGADDRALDAAASAAALRQRSPKPSKG